MLGICAFCLFATNDKNKQNKLGVNLEKSCAFKRVKQNKIKKIIWETWRLLRNRHTASENSRATVCSDTSSMTVAFSSEVQGVGRCSLSSLVKWSLGVSQWGVWNCFLFRVDLPRKCQQFLRRHSSFSAVPRAGKEKLHIKQRKKSLGLHNKKIDLRHEKK